MCHINFELDESVTRDTIEFTSDGAIAFTTAFFGRNPKMGHQNLEHFKNILLSRQRELLDKVNNSRYKEESMKETSGDHSYSLHLADQGSDSMEREQTFMFASLDGNFLTELNEAIDRIEEGSYGICTMCGSEINEARLEAIPYARLCLECKAQEEGQS